MTMPEPRRVVRGYDQLVAAAVMGAQPVTPAIELGQFCVAHNVPVEYVATRLGVTRTTVYSWFTGRRKPRPKKLQELIDFLADMRRRTP
jgi:transcriptional regulator with XRE-family HTH domain